ncbi:MAG: DUF1232 domain-containing protein [Firmicutes bacterium]|nr:DUF1232 domain-containing protein [Bacillota bacterium]
MRRNPFRDWLSAFTSPRVPFSMKWQIALGILYVLSPIDLIPEAWLSFVGTTDDLAVLAFTIVQSIRMVRIYRRNSPAKRERILDTTGHVK